MGGWGRRGDVFSRALLVWYEVGCGRGIRIMMKQIYELRDGRLGFMIIWYQGFLGGRGVRVDSQ